MGNEEPHVLVCDLHRGRSVHSSHGENVEFKKNKNKLKPNPKNKTILPRVKDVNAEWNSEGFKQKKVQKKALRKRKILRSFFGGVLMDSGKKVWE